MGIDVPIRVNGRHTRLPTHVIFEKDFLWSHDPWHDGPDVAAQSVRGADDSSPDSGNGFGPNFFFRYRKQASRLHSRDFANCSDDGGGLGGRGGFSFFWAARCSRFRCNRVSLFFRYHSCLSCLAFSGFLLGISNTTDDGPERWIISSVSSTNHRSRSRPRGDPRNLYPWGGPPLIFFLSIKPLT